MKHFGLCKGFDIFISIKYIFLFLYPSIRFFRFSSTATVLFLFLIFNEWILSDDKIMTVVVMSRTHIPYLAKTVSHNQTVDLLRDKQGVTVQKSVPVLTNLPCGTRRLDFNLAFT